MFNNSGYTYQEDIDMENDIDEFSVNSCGQYRLITMTAYDTVRPVGRKDFQLLYVMAGKASFSLGEETVQLSQGNIFLYAPNEAQHYSYLREDHPEIFWLHYSGHLAKALTDQLRKNSKRGCYVGIHDDYSALFEKIIRELQLRREGFRSLADAYARELFLLMKRAAGESAGEVVHNRQIEKTIALMHREFSFARSVEEYAKDCNMGTCWFIRSFRAVTGVSPQQFLIRLRISKARELLTVTTYNITEISALVGYENPLYFSRLFKKHTGVSPRTYRMTLQNETP